MTTTTCTILLHTLLASPARAVTPGWSASARAGAGYDMNLDAAPDLVDGVAAPSWNTGASLAGSLAGDRLRARLGAAWDLVDLPTLPLLRTHTLQGSLALSIPLAWRLEAGLGPTVAGRWVAETERNALDVGASASLRWRARPWLRTEVGYRFVHRRAVDPAYDRDAHRGLLGAEARLARRTDLRLDLSGEYGAVVTYLPAPTATAARSDNTGKGTGPGEDGQGQSTTTQVFETEFLATSVPAWTTTASLDLRQGLGAHVDLDLVLGIADIRAADAAWQAPWAHLGASFFLP